MKQINFATATSLMSILALTVVSAHAASELDTNSTQSGYSTLSYKVDHHEQMMDGAIWYPAEQDGEAFNTGENPVFYGTDVQKDASVLSGTYPLILMSHGLGGNIKGLSWFNSALAKRGAIVISVDHPHSSTFSFDFNKGLRHWTRAYDFSRVLDEVLSDPRFSMHIDQSQITAAGFSYGGWTALSLGGVKGDRDGYIDHCKNVGPLSSHCGDIERAGVSLTDYALDDWNKSYKDARFTKVIAIDPGLHYGIQKEGVTDLSAETLLIGLGEGDDRILATDFAETGSGFASLVPNAKIKYFAPAYHFSMLPLCKPEGEAILIEEKDDPVCTDPKGGDRAQLHRDIIDEVAQFIGLED